MLPINQTHMSSTWPPSPVSVSTIAKEKAFGSQVTKIIRVASFEKSLQVETCLLCESDHEDQTTKSIKYERLGCDHTFCLVCISSIVEAATSSASSAATTLLRGLGCPYRCANGNIGSAGAEARRLIKSRKPFLRAVFSSAFRRGRDESTRPTQFTASVLEQLFTAKMSMISGTSLPAKKLNKSSLSSLIDAVDLILRERRCDKCTI
jgi:uncharacterized metal-binding protein